MKLQSLTVKLMAIGIIGFICLVASLFVFGLVAERENRHTEVKDEIGQTWGAPQVFIGPMLVVKKSTETENDRYLLPSTLTILSTVEPEIRRRGIFETVVYSEHLKVSGTFSESDIALLKGSKSATLVVSLSDTRSIEKQIFLNWNDVDTPFNPGVNASLLQESGIHTGVTLGAGAHSFSFGLTLHGSEKVMFAPVGRENEVRLSSPWDTPAFTGTFLPSERQISSDAFNATWKVSSFGRNYPQSFENDGTVAFHTLESSAFGVSLDEGVDLYTQVSRSIKYAILFITITFVVFFLFEVLSNVRLHAIQYLLIGLVLALFYLLLLSLSEHIGFLKAYIVATTMTSLLISTYSSKVLGKGSRGLGIFVLLTLLYGYLYFTLNLEDHALLFGSLLLFMLLGGVMYLTRNIEWSALSKNSGE